MKGVLDDIITDRNITIHVCNGNDFIKPNVEAYINREWISKNEKDIIPTNKIQINVKDYFKSLKKKGLIEYDRYDKSKSWKTTINLIG